MADETIKFEGTPAFNDAVKTLFEAHAGFMVAFHGAAIAADVENKRNLLRLCATFIRQMFEALERVGVALADIREIPETVRSTFSEALDSQRESFNDLQAGFHREAAIFEKLHGPIGSA